MSIATVVVTICLAAMFSFSSIVELRGGPRSLAIRDHLGISPTQWRIIGVLELAGAAGALAGLAWWPASGLRSRPPSCRAPDHFANPGRVTVLPS